MGRLKVYTVVCSYFKDDEFIDIPLNDVINQLRIKPTITSWGIDYNLKNIVNYNLRHKRRVKYDVKVLYLNVKTIIETPYQSLSYGRKLTSCVNYLNDIHDYTINKMSNEEIFKLSQKYGNDYTKQIGGF